MEQIHLKDKEVFKQEGRGMANLVDEPYLLINHVCLEPGQDVPAHQANSHVTLQVISGEITVHIEVTTTKQVTLVRNGEHFFKCPSLC